MAWNKPGGNDDRDPWGGGKQDKGPPDLDKILSDFLKKIRAFLHLKPRIAGDWQPSNPKNFGLGFGFIMIIILTLWFLSGFFIVNPAEQAIILRLGKYSETVGPGLHWILRLVDTKFLVDTQKINSFALRGDFLTKSAEEGDLPNQVVNKEVSKATDKSKNLVAVEMTVQYRISDARAYLFNIVDPDGTIQEVAEGALSDVVGQMKLDDVLTTGREMLSSGVLERTRKVLGSYDAGLEVTAVTLRKVQAPDEVQAAFNDVNRAEQDKATYIQQAQAYASKVVPFAQGVAARTLADATAYQQQIVLSAQAQIAKYQALLNIYKTSPNITKERMYLETMQTVFQNTTKILIDSNTGNNILYLPIDKVMQTVRQQETSSFTNPSVNTLSASSNEATGNQSLNNDQSVGNEVR